MVMYIHVYSSYLKLCPSFCVWSMVRLVILTFFTCDKRLPSSPSFLSLPPFPLPPSLIPSIEAGRERIAAKCLIVRQIEQSGKRLLLRK